MIVKTGQGGWPPIDTAVRLPWRDKHYERAARRRIAWGGGRRLHDIGELGGAPGVEGQAAAGQQRTVDRDMHLDFSVTGDWQGKTREAGRLGLLRGDDGDARSDFVAAFEADSDDLVAVASQ